MQARAYRVAYGWPGLTDETNRYRKLADFARVVTGTTGEYLNACPNGHQASLHRRLKAH